MSKKTVSLIVMLFLITLLFVMLAVSPNNQNPKTQVVNRSLPIPVSKAETYLSLIPNPLIISSQSGSLNATINTGNNNISGVQLELMFDPKVITNIAITPGEFMQGATQVIKNVDYVNGRISYALGFPKNIASKKGAGTVAIISFQTQLLPNNQTKILFSPKSFAAMDQTAASALRSTTGSTIFYKSF